MRQPLTRLTLAASGALLGSIGIMMLTDARAFLAMSGIEIGPDPDLLSELKAPSGLLIVTAAIMLGGSVRLRFANPGLLSGGIVYGTYGLSRLLAMIVDGLPSESLMMAAVFELVVAGLLFTLRLGDRARAPAPHRNHQPA